MPAHALVSHQQMDILVAYMEENREFSTGCKSCGLMERQEMKAKWEEVAYRLNSVVGIKKPALKWRDYWNEKKYVVRKKAQAIKANGGPRKGVSLSQCEERILNLMGKLVVAGDSTVRIPFDEASNGPTPPSPESPLSAADDGLSTCHLPVPKILRMPSPQPLSSTPISSESSSAGTNTAGTGAADIFKMEFKRENEEKKRKRSSAFSDGFSGINGSPVNQHAEPCKEKSSESFEDIEEKLLATEEKTANAIVAIASALTAIQSTLAGIHGTLARIEKKMKPK